MPLVSIHQFIFCYNLHGLFWWRHAMLMKNVQEIETNINYFSMTFVIKNDWIQKWLLWRKNQVTIFTTWNEQSEVNLHWDKSLSHDVLLVTFIKLLATQVTKLVCC